MDQRLKNKFDVLVIGGGITGAGVALDAASRGLRTALIEKNDFASGTSNRSSNLIHGGLRYLSNFQFKTSFESSREKTLLKKLAPHLIKDIEFILPCNSLADRLKYSAGLWLYDLMAFDKFHKHLNKYDTESHVGSNTTFKDSFLFHDARTIDYRLVMHVLKMAEAHGAVIANYTKADEVLFNGDMKVTGVLSNNNVIAADNVINCAGAWISQAGDVKVARSKGTHIFVNKKFVRKSVVLPSDDGRIIFCIVKDDGVLIGTTDKKYDGNVNKVVPTIDEAQFLINNVNKFLFDKISVDDIRYSYAGLRPLIESSDDTAAASRDFKIINNNMISVVGGKMTTYRIMAEKAVDQITTTKSCTKDIKLFPTNVDHPLFNRYGSMASNIDINNRFKSSDKFWKDEIRYVIKHEHAIHLTDVLLRRTGIAYAYDLDDNPLVHEVAVEMSKILDWNMAKTHDEIDEYYKYISSLLVV